MSNRRLTKSDVTDSSSEASGNVAPAGGTACICGEGGPGSYEGPREDCAEHGRRTKSQWAGLRAIVEASTAGKLAYGEMPTELMLTLPDVTVEVGRAQDASKVWVAHLDNGDGTSTTVAVTGNGPQSEANARFFAGARNAMLLLIDEIDTLDIALQTIHAGIEAGEPNIAHQLLAVLVASRAGKMSPEAARAAAEELLAPPTKEQPC